MIKVVINISQFGVCESRNDLSHLGGVVLRKSNPNFALIKKAIYENRKLLNENYIWLFDCYDKRIDFFYSRRGGKECIVKEMLEIYRISNWMIFWYASDCNDLTTINSRNDLSSYLEDSLSQQPIELYFKTLK